MRSGRRFAHVAEAALGLSIDLVQVIVLSCVSVDGQELYAGATRQAVIRVPR